MAIVKYFSDDKEINHVFGAPKKGFMALGGIPTKHNRFDSFRRLVGYVNDENGKYAAPVTRTIFYKNNPSLHKCDARCQNAKGHDCECSCGGANHGINS